MINKVNRKVKFSVNFSILVFILGSLLLFNACLDESPFAKTNKTDSNSGINTDNDGNVFNTVTIGNQVWMAENLRSTKYRDGSSITNVTGTSQWGALTTGAYCSVLNNSTNSKTYGQLYNWYAITDSRNIAPKGWHVPTYYEWDEMFYYIGVDSLAGEKLKETGTTHWTYPNTGATNIYGFNALPSGWRQDDGLFYAFGYSTFWWTSTENASNTLNAYGREIDYNKSSLDRYYTYKSWGLTVRCVRDEAANTSSTPMISYSGSYYFYNGTPIIPTYPTNIGGLVYSSAVVSTLAGSGISGSTNGTGSSASFNSPNGIATDLSGNIFIADKSNHKIRKITSSGVVSTFAGSGTAGSTDGTGTAASFNNPEGLTSDASGNVYVADAGNNKIRKITSAGVVTTFAGSGTAGFLDGTGTTAKFYYPYGITIDASGNVFVSDRTNNRIRKVTSAGTVSTLAGSGTAGYADGTGTFASFNSPLGITVDANGFIYVVDCYNQRIRRITSSGVVSTLAGSGSAGVVNGKGVLASFNNPTGITVDASGNVYIVDNNNQVIRLISPAGLVTTLAGSGTAGSADGTNLTASFYYPLSICIDTNWNLFLTDQNNNKIRKITQYGYFISPALPAGLNFDTSTGTISGTPSVSSSSKTYTVIAINEYGNYSTTFNLTIY